MMGKMKFDKILESIKKPKKDDEDYAVLEELFKKSELQKKHKFTGRELTECLKRLQFKIAKVGDILQHDGDITRGYSIIIQGSCSKHFPCVDDV